MPAERFWTVARLEKKSLFWASLQPLQEKETQLHGFMGEGGEGGSGGVKAWGKGPQTGSWEETQLFLE